MASRAQSPEQLSDWVTRVAESSRTPIEAPFFAEWTFERLGAPTAAQLDDVRRRIQGHPDHPDRQLLAKWEAQLRGEDKDEVRLWASEDAWRLAARSLRQPDEYFDHGSIERTAWSMTPGALAVSPHGISQRQFDYTRMGRSRREQLCTLLSGGLSVAGEMRIPLVIAPRSDGGCLVSGQVTYGSVTHRLEAGCSWQSGGPTVEYVSLESTGGDSPGTRRWTSTGWQASELGPWCAGEVVEHDPHGTPVLRTRLVALQPCAPEDVERRAAVPPLRGDDPVRGTVTFVGITDFRDRGSYTSMDDTGNQVVRALAEHPGAIESRRLRYAGWLLAASITAGLVALRVRSILANRRRAKHSANTGEGSRP